MSTGGSVTRWISELKSGDEEALVRLHERYWPFLVSVAGRRLSGPTKRMADEEDVAEQAFWDFYHQIKDGRIPRLSDRHDLLSLLVVITVRKAINQVERERRQKRGGGGVRGESALYYLANSAEHQKGMDNGKGPWPTPAEEAILNDCYQYYVSNLPENYREIAEYYLAGFSSLEISDQIGCSKRTVERKIFIILNKWREMAGATLSQV